MANAGAFSAMRIPPYYHKPSWQQFFSGLAIGGAISWCMFLYIFGVWQEKQANQIHKQEEDIQELKSDIKIWQDEFQALNKKNIEQMTLQKIQIKISNGEKYNLDRLSIYQIEEGVKDDINMVIAKDLETVYKSRELLRRTIENKVVKVSGKRYRLEIKEIFIYTTLSIKLDIHLEE
ncbi:sporulation membrane protein YtrI [Bacillus sp. 1NLA3E]|uniref:sporulation membrane protein YtrI n=1 Tax=Bacillus sp. 1NLA3E TaxID=666686 RepID=UPI001F1C10DF|nr:sporulation membrane protein YtrI [Bacillus sp. 1NLA3E]